MSNHQEKDPHPLTTLSSVTTPVQQLLPADFTRQYPGLALVLYNTILAIPFSYLITHLNKSIFRYLGYEKIMRCPSGILGSRILFVVINLVLIFGYMWVEREERKKEERLRWIESEIERWDGEIEKLEGEKRRRQEIMAQQQLKSEALSAIAREKGSLSYEKDSVVNADGVKEWDFVHAVKKGRALDQGGSGLKGLMAGSKLPKLRKKKEVVVEKK